MLIQATTARVRDEENNQEPALITDRNDGLINSHNPVQLSAWTANVDMQYCVSKRKVIEYITKYATKCEPRSQTMKEVYSNIVRKLKDDSSALKIVHKLLVNSVGERDFSAHETCHLFFQLPLVKSTRHYIILSLDQVGERPEDGETSRGTAPTILDHYTHRPSNSTFEFITSPSTTKQLGSTPKHHKIKIKAVISSPASQALAGPIFRSMAILKS